MTWTRGTYVRKDADRGTTPQEARLALEGLFESFGIIRGLDISGTAGWSYNVAAGHLVTKRAAGDGVILFANDGPVAFPTIAAPGTGSRWDVLWVRHNDVDRADADSAVTFGVTNGVPTGSPVVPTIPNGAFELGRALVPSGASDTSSLTITPSSVRARLIRDPRLSALPFAEAQGGNALPTVAANSSESISITFPPGRFTVPPRVIGYATQPRNTTVVASGITTAGCTLTAYNWTGTASGAGGIVWRAVQMTSASADG